uniref:Lactoylglutathione lyase n=1 Tax=Opuntia streptacantha TaxID=393608 RepID=A0A7C8ZR94_OPUST
MEGKQEIRRREDDDHEVEKIGERKHGDDHEHENEQTEEHPLPLMTLNHVSRLCRSVEDSMEFYTKVLGFVVIERPHAFDSFDGAWLFNYGIGIHLVQSKDEERLPSDKEGLDPMDNHISFQVYACVLKCMSWFDLLMHSLFVFSPLVFPVEELIVLEL